MAPNKHYLLNKFYVTPKQNWSVAKREWTAQKLFHLNHARDEVPQLSL